MKITRDIKELLSKVITDETVLALTLTGIETTVNNYVDALLIANDKDSVPLSRFLLVKKQFKELQQANIELTLSKTLLLTKLDSNNPELLTTLKTKLAEYLKQTYLTAKSKWLKAKLYFTVEKNHKDFERRNNLSKRFTFEVDGNTLLPLLVIKKNLLVYLILNDAGAIALYKALKPLFNDKAPKTPLKTTTTREALQRMGAL